ncbi:MAG TPA: tetratricopeptide repeat protein [Opitutaceae bacterium]|nr:tetratricopeptide repeat protein [Opitutaceae bacterium]
MRRSGRTALAEDVARETVIAFRANKGTADYDVTLHLYGLALTLAFVGKLEEAQQTIAEIMTYQERVKGNARLAYIPYSTLALQAQIEEVQGNLARSEATAREALRLARTIHGDAHPFVSVPMGSLASVLLTVGKAAEAENLFGELLSDSLAAKPSSTYMLIERAKFYGRRGNWEKAVSDASRAVAHQPNYLEAQVTQAFALLGASREGELRAATDTMLDQYRGAQTPFVASRTALLCLLLPQPPEKRLLLSQLAEAGTSGEMGSYWTGRAQLARALFFYRNGDFEDCLAWASKIAANPRSDLQVAAGAVSALAQFALKDPRAAATLDAAKAKFSHLASLQSGDFGGSWKEDYESDIGLGWFGWVIARRLLDEATTGARAGK